MWRRFSSGENDTWKGRELSSFTMMMMRRRKRRLFVSHLCLFFSSEKLSQHPGKATMKWCSCWERGCWLFHVAHPHNFLLSNYQREIQVLIWCLTLQLRISSMLILIDFISLEDIEPVEGNVNAQRRFMCSKEGEKVETTFLKIKKNYCPAKGRCNICFSLQHFLKI